MRGAGVPVFDTDVEADVLLQPDGACYERVVAAFGDLVKSADGRIDKASLASIVFADAVQREKLNALVHPAVREGMERWLSQQTGAAASVEIPLLYEAGFDSGWDAVVCVACERHLQFERLKDKRGLSREEAAKRIEAQMPLYEKVRKSNFVMWNNWDMKTLEEQVRRALKSILEKSI